MKFLKTEGENLVFHLGKREKGLLLDLLKMYPVVPPAHYRISTSDESLEGCQHLLDEALTEHRTENRRQLESMLGEPGRFQVVATGFRLVLSPAQLEWILQVLNDIRVGSWIQLGSPDEKRGKTIGLSLANARYLWAMELAGHIQSILLSGQGMR